MAHVSYSVLTWHTPRLKWSTMTRAPGYWRHFATTYWLDHARKLTPGADDALIVTGIDLHGETEIQPDDPRLTGAEEVARTGVCPTLRAEMNDLKSGIARGRWRGDMLMRARSQRDFLAGFIRGAAPCRWN